MTEQLPTEDLHGMGVDATADPAAADIEAEGQTSAESTVQAWSQLPDLVQSLQPAAACVAEFQRSKAENNFLKDIRWSPDGLCLLASSDDNSVRLLELPAHLLQTSLEPEEGAREWPANADVMSAALQIQEGETVYDLAWLPWMNSSDPSTCCFFTTSRDNPVHCWDAFTGEMRASYCAYTDAEELTAAYSVAFDNTSNKLYCGFNNCIRIYDLERPGRQHKILPTFKRANRETSGQRGIISCIAFNPDKSGLFATGSYSRNVGLFNAATGKLLYNMQGHRGGVTQVQWAPDGNYLFSGGRKDDEILCWDVRKTGDILHSIPRSVATNQRIQFDIDHSGRYLATASHKNKIIVYDLWASGVPALAETSVPCQMVNGATFHPYKPYLAASSGSRTFHLADKLGEEEEETSVPGETNSISMFDNSVLIMQVC